MLGRQWPSGRRAPRAADGAPARTRGGSPARIATTAMALMLLTLGAVALHGGAPQHTESAAQPVKSAAATGERSADPENPRAAAGDLGGQPAVAPDEPLLVPPADLVWRVFMGVALPYSAPAGPTVTGDPVVAGFARSQQGALLAAAHLGTRYLLTPGEGWRLVLDRQVLPGAGREAFARMRAGLDPQAEPDTYGQFAGFRVVTFTPDVAVLQLVSRFPAGVLQVTTSTVHWRDGDWRLQLQPDGGPSPTAQAVPSLDGFVVWGA
jgi:hypothetical protein